MSLLNKSRKSYQKAHEAYIKKLVNLVKTDQEYEWYYIVQILLLLLQRRLEYFKKGDNVWQTDETRLVSVNTLDTAINLLTTACNFEDNNTLDINKIEEYRENEDKAWKDAFTYIGENIRLWWD